MARKFLLDTNALLFWLEGSRRLAPSVRDELAQKENSVFVSSIGRLTMWGTPARLVLPFNRAAGLITLPVSMEHAFAIHELSLHHADPFDRLLVAQARYDGLTLVTSDLQLAAYDVDILLAE